MVASIIKWLFPRTCIKLQDEVHAFYAALGIRLQYLPYYSLETSLKEGKIPDSTKLQMEAFKERR